MGECKLVRNSGFTLIELLVVITVIGLLSSIIIVNINNARIRANAARTLKDFKTIEKAFYLLADEQDKSMWWDEDDFGLGSNPTISSLVENTDLGKFLSEAPSPPQGGTAFYQYDNDPAQGTLECPDPTPLTPGYEGVNILLRGVEQIYFDRLDEMVDNNNG